jgi:putative addiction module killer protein
MNIRVTAEFHEWAGSLSDKLQALVNDRLDRIRYNDHLGDTKSLEGGLFELRWRNGVRVYFAYTVDKYGRAIFLLLGGDKDGQNRDIRKARNILARETA